MSERKRRSIVPGFLIVAGLAGLGLAAASELDLGWNGTFQAGTVTVETDCQQDGEIAATFSEPTFAAADGNTGTPWEVASLEFSNISEACQGRAFEVAVRSDGDAPTWTRLGGGTVEGRSVTAPIGALNPQDFDDVALTIYGDGASD